MKPLISIFAMLLAPAAMAQEVIDDPQWIYRDIDGTERAAAIFLSWDYRSVIVRAICEEEEGRLRLEYFPGAFPADAEPLVLIVDDVAMPMETTQETSGDPLALVGRLPATPALAEALQHAVDVRLDAPNEMGEPWYLERAEPLSRIATWCATPRG
ncbi:MAG: hypothetical protein EON89_07995 [Brevundimonas sp.]|nr:MAG: hypothetical protein EON89_07995 [Brevundimonas sp.]